MKSVTVKCKNDWQHVNAYVTDLIIESNCCNEEDLTTVDFSQFKNLKSVKIGDNCFIHAKEVIFSNMQNLKTIEIGEKGFTEYRNWNSWPDEARDAHFICTNNTQLISLIIGRYSFSDFNECKLESKLNSSCNQ